MARDHSGHQPAQRRRDPAQRRDLYRSVQRMLEQGLIEETRTRPAPDEDDERRRFYRLTAVGGAVARGEAQRLQDLVTLARASRFAPESA